MFSIGTPPMLQFLSSWSPSVVVVSLISISAVFVSFSVLHPNLVLKFLSLIFLSRFIIRCFRQKLNCKGCPVRVISIWINLVYSPQCFYFPGFNGNVVFLWSLFCQGYFFSSLLVN